MRRQNSIVFLAFSIASICTLGAMPAATKARINENQVERAQFERFQKDREALSTGFALMPAQAPSETPAGVFGTTLFSRPLFGVQPLNDGKAWSLELNPSVGYDSNPDALHSASGSAFGEVDGTFSYDLWRQGKSNDDPMLSYTDQLTGSYEFDGKVFDGKHVDADEIDNIFSLSYAHLSSSRLRLALDASQEYDNIDGTSFLNKTEVKPAIRYQFDADLGVEGVYTYRHNDYLFTPVTPRRNPDSDRHILGCNLLLLPKDSQNGTPSPLIKGVFSSLTIGYAHTWNDAAGADFDYHGDEVSVQLKGVRLWTKDTTVGTNLVSKIKYTHRWNSYLHPNSLSASGQSRYDEVNLLDVEFDYALVKAVGNTPSVMLYGRFSIDDSGSNIQPKDFSENIFRVGLDIQF